MKLLKRIVNLVYDNYREIYLATLIAYLAIVIMSNTNLTVSIFFDFTDTLQNVMKVLRYLTYLIFILLIAVAGIKKITDTKKIALFGTVFMISTLISHNTLCMIFYLIIVAGAPLNNKDKLKTYLMVQALLVLGVVGLSSIDIIPDYIFDPGVRNRYSLGFTWTTYVPGAFLFIIMNTLLLQEDKANSIQILYILFVAILLFILTDTKFVFIVQMIFLVGMLVKKKVDFSLLKVFLKKYRKLISLLPFVLLVCILGASYFYDVNNSLLVTLNQMLSNRLSLGNEAIQNYGITMLGNNIEWVGNTIGNINAEAYNFVDSSYLKYLLNYGVIPTLLLCCGYYYLTNNAIKNNQFNLTFILVLIQIYSLFEPRLYELCFNPFILLLGDYFMNCNESRKGTSNEKNINRVCD